MKKILTIIVVVAAVAGIVWYAFNSKVPATDKQVPADTDSASSINASLDAMTVDDSSGDFKSMDSDINTL